MTTKIKKGYYDRDVAGRIGLIISFIMGILFLIEGVTRISLMFLFYPDTPLILMCGILAIVGVLLGLKRYKYGRILCLIAGILAIVGFLIFYSSFPFRFVLTMFAIFIPVAYFLFFINIFSPFIFLIGGILSVISEESVLSYREKRNFNPIQRKKVGILFCSDCGKKVLPASKFCINCGKQFNILKKD